MSNMNAEVMVHWPGKSTAMCGGHADYARRVADAMGMSRATETPLAESQECKNCTNEEAAVVAYERVVDACCRAGEEFVKVRGNVAASAAAFGQATAAVAACVSSDEQEE